MSEIYVFLICTDIYTDKTMRYNMEQYFLGETTFKQMSIWLSSQAANT